MTVWLDPNARAQIEREAARQRLVETGGPLFGFAGDGDLVVIGAGGPGPRARHRPTSFRPDREAVDRAIERAHAASKQRYRYLGSWHTHPFGRATPSGRDIATARDISRDEPVDLPQPLLLIQATLPTRRTLRDSDLRAYHWSTDLDTLLAMPLTIVRDDERQYPMLDVDWDTVVR